MVKPMVVERAELREDGHNENQIHFSTRFTNAIEQPSRVFVIRRERT